MQIVTVVTTLRIVTATASRRGFPSRRGCRCSAASYRYSVIATACVKLGDDLERAGIQHHRLPSGMDCIGRVEANPDCPDAVTTLRYSAQATVEVLQVTRSHLLLVVLGLQ